VYRLNPLSEVRSQSGARERAIKLTADERTAVVELGLRPTYELQYPPDLNVETMLGNALSWMQAAEITSAGNAGIIPPTLRAEIAALLDTAIPEATLDLERTTSDRDKWRAGDPSRGFVDLGGQETESLYTDMIERDRRILQALKSVSAKVDPSADPRDS
jgi:hypothetical protein